MEGVTQEPLKLQLILQQLKNPVKMTNLTTGVKIRNKKENVTILILPTNVKKLVESVEIH